MIRFSISQKLMCAFLGLTLIVLIATLGLARWSFDRGFLDYVNSLEQLRLERASENIALLYTANNGQWEKIPRPQIEFRLNQFPEPGSSLGGPPKRGQGLPEELRGEDEGRPPARLDGRRPSDLGYRPPPRGSSNRPKTPPTALFDNDGNKIAGHVLGNTTPDTINVPVIVDGETVGILRSEPKRQVRSSIETAFSRQQWVTSVIIGVASLILAALVSWGLTRLLVSPVRNIIHNVNRLSKGDYSQLVTKNYNDEFGLLVEDLNHLTNTLEKNRGARNRWLADISHELRTPLAILTGEIEALKDGIRTFGPQQLESLDQEIQRLRFLVDDLYQLSLSDIGGLRYEFAEMDLVECVSQAITTSQLSSEEKGINITFARVPSVMISADSQRISQLLANLLRNSLAYTNDYGRVEVMLNTFGGQAILEVHDTPPGVKHEDCNRLFEALYREDESRTRRGSGAGLGLAICRNIVEAHRGKITATPSPLGGLRVTVELPLLSKGESLE